MSKLRKIAFEDRINQDNDKFLNKLKEIPEKEIKDKMYSEFADFYIYSGESPKDAHIDFMDSGRIYEILEEMTKEKIEDIDDPRIEEIFDKCAEYAIQRKRKRKRKNIEKEKKKKKNVQNRRKEKEKYVKYREKEKKNMQNIEKNILH